MDDPLIAILFAEELTHFILAEHGFEWPADFGVRKFKTHVSKSRFNSVIGICVLDIIRSNAETIRTSYDKLLEGRVNTIEAFRFESIISTIFHFRGGYEPELFLNMSAMLIGLSALYFKDGQEEMAIGASQVLAYVLNLYIYHGEFDARIGWFNLSVRAQNMRRCLSRLEAGDSCDNNTDFYKKEKKKMADGIFFAMTFAEELMTLFYLNEGISWEPLRGIDRIFPMYASREKTFHVLKVATAIEVIIERNAKDIADCHKDLVDSRADTKEGFSYYALKAAPAYFPKGCCPEALLCFCAMVAGVCRMCFRPDSGNEVLDCAAEVIGMVVSAHTLTREFDLHVYDRLVQVAEKIGKALVSEDEK